MNDSDKENVDGLEGDSISVIELSSDSSSDFEVLESYSRCEDKHTKPPFKDLGCHDKFQTIHIDFVGPLPSNAGKQHLVTIFDRGTRWFSAYPTS